MRLFYFLISVWLILLPALPLSAERCMEESPREVCSENESEPEDCCKLGEACACCLTFVLPAAEIFNPDAPELQQPQSQYRSVTVPLLSHAIWHPPKA